LWLFEAVTGALATTPTGIPVDPVRVCLDVREMLDVSHTRGDLKQHLVRDLARFVSPVAGAVARLREWRRAGKRLFVVTNSDRAYASAVLDLVVGPDWGRLFAVVATSSAKPAFFERHPTPMPCVERESARDAFVVEGTCASAIEGLLGVAGRHVLYVGDNPIADIRAARGFGWRTVHVVAEMGVQVANARGDHDSWGSPFAAKGERSWFARMVEENADVACDRVDRLLDTDPDQPLVDTRRESA
jgi:FMN phosphatase YigB (HAD superfamily)